MARNTPGGEGPRPSKFTREQEIRACRAYADTNSRVAVADVCGVSLRTINRRMTQDPEFRLNMMHAKAQYVRKLEMEARRRAVDGVTQSKPGPGGEFYDVTLYSDTLLLHLLKKADPVRHGDKVVIDQQITIEGSIGLDQLSPQNRDRLRIILEESMDGEIIKPIALE